MAGKMSHWRDGVVYFCGEYDPVDGAVVNSFLIMLIETELRANYREGKVVKLGEDLFILRSRESDKKAKTVTYHLSKMAPPSPTPVHKQALGLTL